MGRSVKRLVRISFSVGPAFAFEVAAGELAGRGRFFAVIDREREKILAGFGLGRGDRGHEDDGIAQSDGDGAVGLFGQFAGFDDDLIAPDEGCNSFCHNVS